jgi:2-oxoglutarate ferredoxin oxidoreductase subunit beta
VWVITGDGDGLSIGGNHLLHALRRNMDLKILLFNNQIYGLTKGQYSPTSALGTRAASTPAGSVDYPVSPVTIALGAGATFVARVADTDAKTMLGILERAYQHKGSVFIEILQNCPVFNDGIWDAVKDDPAGKQMPVVDGKPLRFGENGKMGVVLDGELRPHVVEVGDGTGQTPEKDLLVHREQGSSAYAFLLAGLGQPDFPIPVGVLHRDPKPSYEQLAHAQIADAIAKQGAGDLEKLMYSGMVWEVGADGVKH